MSATKGIISAIRTLFRYLFRPLEGNAWVLAITIVTCSILGISSYHLWKRYGDTIIGHPRYRLDPEHLVVTPQPSWIRTDVTASAVTYGQLRDANLLDKELVLQVKQAFGVQPWIRRVRRVNKQYPSTVEVDVEYRRPLAMVEVPANMFPGYDYEGLVPIDAEGFLLPVEMEEQEAGAFPKVSGVDTAPAGPPGSPWGDTRVAQAARIVALLEEIWKPLDLYRVSVPVRRSAVASPDPDVYVLITRQGRRFSWGSAPGKELRGEDTAAEKVAGLKKYLQDHGSLDLIGTEQQTSLQELPSLRYAEREVLEATSLQ